VILAEWVGGPHDGWRVVVERPELPVVLAIPLPPRWGSDVGVAFDIRVVQPTLTRDGWRLYYSERPT
jgi:hypothetical protein